MKRPSPGSEYDKARIDEGEGSYRAAYLELSSFLYDCRLHRASFNHGDKTTNIENLCRSTPALKLLFYFYRLMFSSTILQHTPLNFVPKSQLNSTARSCAHELPSIKLSCLFRSLLADVASDVGLAVDASVAGAGADLLRLDVVVVSAGVLVADGLDTADVDVGESGSVAEVGVDTCDPVSNLSLGLFP